MIQEVIALLAERRDLTSDQAAAVMRELMSGEATPAQVGGFLIALRMKGETVGEITGFAATMRELATRIETSRRPLVDTCGTGGDRSGTFNVSTTAAFVVAGAGIAVAKHGNRSATSQCGSADVLEALGVRLDVSPEQVGRCIDEIGIGFLFARSLHTAMKHVAGARQELKVRTVFNILGPLTNPANACGQVMGVFDRSLVEPLAHVLAKLGTRHTFVFAGCDGLDELTLAGPSYVAEAKLETERTYAITPPEELRRQGIERQAWERTTRVRTYEITPEDVGFTRSSKDSILGGNAETNAKLLRSVLEGTRGPHRDIVVLNSTAAILAGAGASDWKEGRLRAEESINSGAALAKLDALVKYTHVS